MANHTILLIDYEPRSIERFRDPLVGAGYAVEIATDGVSGIEAFHRLNPDLVLVEAMIPKKHGFEVCQELKRTAHGRRTPVIITTGVYKGRKYRTQALHIYGCDEYIEKPIAPEQLLQIVGKLLGSDASGPAARTAQTKTGSSETSGGLGSLGHGDAIAKSAPKVVNDDGEDEIMARLDAILPTGAATQAAAAPERVGVVAAIDEDPFAQMKAELDAELGALPDPLPFDSDSSFESIQTTFPSDQVASPSVLEALPAPEEEPLPSPVSATAPLVKDVEAPGQLVSFETKRPRKGKKSERQGKRNSPKPAQVELAMEAVAVAGSKPAAPASDAAPASEMTLPHGTIVESELESTTERRGKGVWIWSAVGVIAVAAAVLLMSRGTSGRSQVVSVPAPTPEPVASAPAASNADPAPSSPVATLPSPPETPTEIAASPKPTVSVPESSTPKPSPDRIATATPGASAAGSRKASRPAPKSTVVPPVAPPTSSQTGPSEPSASGPTKAPATKESAAAGVETVPDPASASPNTKLSPGALIPIDVADTMPVAISHRAPNFPAQTKQERLSGRVIMNVLINDRGTVEQVVLVTGVPSADVNDAAIRAAKAWTYRPATKNGVPVKVWKSEHIVFFKP